MSIMCVRLFAAVLPSVTYVTRCSQRKFLFCHEVDIVNVELRRTLKSYYMFIINPSLLMAVIYYCNSIYIANCWVAV